MLTVEQADRDAAAMAFYCKPLADGAHDADRRVQAFAAHRIASEQAGRIAGLEEAAGVAEAWLRSDYSEECNVMAAAIIDDIRALKGPQG